MLQSNLNDVSNDITLELMRRDASFHPDPAKFDAWAKGGPCPYENSITQRVHHFNINRDLWVPGPPTMTGYDLLMAIAKEKNWKIG